MAWWPPWGEVRGGPWVSVPQTCDLWGLGEREGRGEGEGAQISPQEGLNQGAIRFFFGLPLPPLPSPPAAMSVSSGEVRSSTASSPAASGGCCGPRGITTRRWPRVINGPWNRAPNRAQPAFLKIVMEPLVCGCLPPNKHGT